MSSHSAQERRKKHLEEEIRKAERNEIVYAACFMLFVVLFVVLFIVSLLYMTIDFIELGELTSRTALLFFCAALAAAGMTVFACLIEREEKEKAR